MYLVSTVSWGSWYDHVKSYWVEREKRNILYLFYEDMKEVRRTCGPLYNILHGPSMTRAFCKNPPIYSCRTLGVKWSASWGTWTCRCLTRSSAKLWSSRPSKTWRRTRWPTTPASQHRFLIRPSLPSWEKVHMSAPSPVQQKVINPNNLIPRFQN